MTSDRVYHAGESESRSGNKKGAFIETPFFRLRLEVNRLDILARIL